MTHDRKPPRQPLFWAALAFSLGLWIGVRAWRPPSWWVIVVLPFVFAASWFLPKRAWLAKALSLGAWILLGDATEGPSRTGETPVAPLALTYGTRLRIRAKLHPARNYRNPGAFDYEGYLRDNGISVLGSAEANNIERLPGFSGSRI